MIKLICKVCKKGFEVESHRKDKTNYCSYKCYWQSLKGQHLSSKTEFKKGNSKSKNAHSFPEGKKHPNWNNGINISTQGYVYILKPNHPRTNCRGYVKRSDFVMEQILGRYLMLEEVVHHKGEKYPINSIKNKQDDRPKNLQLFKNNIKHLQFHYPKGKFFHKLTPNRRSLQSRI